MKIFITGAGGFIGRKLVREALDEGNLVVAQLRIGEQIDVSHESLEIFTGDLCDVQMAALATCDSLIHLAAAGVTSGSEDWQTCIQVNVVESMNLWLRAAAAGIKRMIICGSCFEYGTTAALYERIPSDAVLRPTGPYHASKAAATQVAMAMAVDKKLRLTIIRPFHVYGDGEANTRFWPSLKSAALSGNDFPMTAGGQIRDFLDVKVVAAVILKTLDRVEVRSGEPEIINIGSGKPTSIREFAVQWWNRLNATGRLKFGDIEYRPNEVMQYVPEVEPWMVDFVEQVAKRGSGLSQ